MRCGHYLVYFDYFSEFVIFGWNKASMQKCSYSIQPKNWNCTEPFVHNCAQNRVDFEMETSFASHLMWPKYPGCCECECECTATKNDLHHTALSMIFARYIFRAASRLALRRVTWAINDFTFITCTWAIRLAYSRQNQSHGCIDVAVNGDTIKRFLVRMCAASNNNRTWKLPLHRTIDSINVRI